MGLLDGAAEWFKARDTKIQQWYSDFEGRYAFAVNVDGQRLIVVAKKYLHDGDASFMAQTVVERASDQDAYILLFVGGDRRLLFDPDTIDAVGTHNSTEDMDRKARGERWIDVPADVSVDFRDWYEHREQPPEPGDFVNDDDDGRPAKPWDIRAWADGGDDG